jgi:hypothetical protein
MRERMEDHPVTHKLLKKGEMIVEPPLSFMKKPRNPKVIQKREKMRETTTS